MERIENRYKIERLHPAQWADYKKIRLDALSKDPGKFGSNFDKESRYTDSEWESLLMNDNRAIFGLYSPNKLIGLTGVALYHGEPGKAIFFSSYIDKEHRGKGLAKLFYEERIGWARSKQCSSIIVSHRQGNNASKSANQRFDFIFTHYEETVWPDGQRDVEVFYKLEL